MDSLLGLIAILALVALFTAPMRCYAPTANRPHRGCQKRPRGLFDACSAHGRNPRLRLLGLIGGEHLPNRRVCGKCGGPTQFGRRRGDGKPYLGCASYPECRNLRLLSRHRLST